MFKNTELLKRFNELHQSTKLAVFFITAAILVALATNQKTESLSPLDTEAVENLSTFIPAGHRLVPIEILNSGSLDSILGRYGFVDLYLETQKRPFARSVRIVKSLDGSGDWAALVNEQLADDIMSVGARFRVAVQSDNGSGETIQLQRPQTKRRIVYEGE